MKKPILWTLVIVAAVAVAALLFYQLQTAPPAPQAVLEPPVEALPTPQAKTEPEIRYPIETDVVAEQPLPPLDGSDDAVRARLAELLGEPSLVELLNLQTFVRRVVATVDNLPRRKLAPRLMPVKPAPGQLLTTKADTLVLSEKNYARYSPYVRLLDAVDTQKLVAFYTGFYPLFQKAYEDLGYPGAYFNDRLVEVIDDLLAAPHVEAPIALVRPKIYYRFADPNLEALSAGQKILIRIGPDNAAKTKAKLHEIRSALVAKAPDR